MCKYCEYDDKIVTISRIGEDHVEAMHYITGNSLRLVRMEDDGSFKYKDTPINYCPVCGRKLTEEEGVVANGN